MNFLVDQIDGTALAAAWQEFDHTAGLRPIKTETDYDHTVALMNRVLDVMGEDEQHPLAGLLELLAKMVSSYETIHYPVEQL
ncbi:HTH-type transcriptional regulator / antitoxin HigA [Duganella sp. CF517]|uniref:hypothetical protein n=1 Tax=Duganella sp. CF517 TaxID=1881038 RepID=UPI0008B7AAE6|nr:hypothetical protein [Duganella sp. CF517]SEN58867.1 HTH-type transcriptional regulator / antitoxin HigA [Duganella sp. CF517]